MTKLYGNLTNRFNENKNLVGEIKVGDYATEYLYSDRHAYEVVEVKDQKHLTIRRLDHKRIDNNGMSECQDYEYISNPKNQPVELVYKYDKWFAKHLDKFTNKIESHKINITFGVADEYYDYSF